MDARFSLTSEEKRWIWRAALHRTRGKLQRGVNDSVVKDDFVVLNALGIVGEIAWARWFGVPWFQNPGQGGDHSRAGDLELRDGLWIEVKTSRNPSRIAVPWTTGERWDWLAFAHYDGKQVALLGVVDQEVLQSRGEETQVKDVRGRTVSMQTLASKWLVSSYPLMRASLMQPATASGPGLRCPWCGQPWRCKDESCVSSLQRREAYLASEPGHRGKG